MRVCEFASSLTLRVCELLVSASNMQDMSVETRTEKIISHKMQNESYKYRIYSK